MSGDFGKRLEKCRVEKGISIEILSKYVGISAKFIKRIEQGDKKARVSYPVIIAIADALEVDVNRLIEVPVEII